MKLDDFLDRFEKEYHLKLDRSLYDAVSVLINREVVIHFKELRPNCFIIYSLICPVPSHSKEKFLEEVLKTNLYGTQTSGMNFGLDTKTNSIVQFFRFEPIPYDYQEIFEKIKKFVTVAQNYKKIFVQI